MNNSGYFITQMNTILDQLFAGAPGDFKLNEDGLLAVSFEAGVDVILRAVDDQEKIVVSSEVVGLGGSDSNVLRKALELNHFGIAPLGAFFALDETQSSLLLCRVGEAQLLDVELLGDFLTEFVAGVSEMRRQIGVTNRTPEADENSIINGEGSMRV